MPEERATERGPFCDVASERQLRPGRGFAAPVVRPEMTSARPGTETSAGGGRGPGPHSAPLVGP